MKYSVAILLILMLLCASACAALASEAYQVKIDYMDQVFDRVKLRAAPSTGAEVLGQYYKGVFMQVMDEQGDWLHVRLGGREGYMMRKFTTAEIGEQDHLVQGFPGMVRFPGENGTLPLYAEASASAKVLADMPEGYVTVLGTVGGDWLHIGYDDGKGAVVYGYASSADITHTDNFASAVVDTGNPEQKLNLRIEPAKQGKIVGQYYNGTSASILFDDTVNGDDWERVRIGDAVGYMLRDRLDYSTGGVPRFLPPRSKVLEDAVPYYETLNAERPAGTLTKDTSLIVLGARGDRYYVRLDVDRAYQHAYVEKESVQPVSRSASVSGKIKSAQTLHHLDTDGKMKPIGVDAPVGADALICGSLSKDGVTFSEYVFSDAQWVSCWVEHAPHTYASGFVSRDAVEYDKELEYGW